MTERNIRSAFLLYMISGHSVFILFKGVLIYEP